MPPPRRAGRSSRARRAGTGPTDAAHGVLLGIFAPIVGVPMLLPTLLFPAAEASCSLLAYVVWLATVAKFAVDFGRAAERAGLTALLVVSCGVAIPEALLAARAVLMLAGG